MRIAYIEPFEAGSHAAFGRALRAACPEHEWVEATLPGRHWKWRMRGSGLWFAGQATLRGPFDLIFASSYLPLADFLAARPDLRETPSVLYFHENQLAFPVRPEFSGPRDHHFGFTQLVSSTVADALWFNSRHNLESFYAGADELLAAMPDARPPKWIESLRARSRVMPLLLELDDRPLAPPRDARDPAGPLIAWTHRWEHDKGPEDFFAAIEALCERGLRVRLGVAGRRFARAPEVFATMEPRLRARPEVTLRQWGPLDSRADYLDFLREVDIAVSTAKHEFFGISMVEATHAGALPLVPDALAYPEIFGAEHRYPPGELAPRLIEAVEAWHAGEALRADRRSISAPFGLERGGASWREALERVREAGPQSFKPSL